MKNKRSLSCLVGRYSLAMLALAVPAHSAVLYQDNFDAGTSAAGWTANKSGADSFANFAYDYSTLGIPSAPNSTGGSTIGMNFLANQSGAVFQGISASPVGQSFPGNVVITFDMWLNYVGPLGPGGSGSTQAATFGWGTDGVTAEWAGGSNSVMFATTVDGGSASDYRVYVDNVQPAGALTAPSANNSDAYYSVFTSQSAPAGQLSLFPGQTGVTDAGETAFAWRAVQITRIGNNVTWFIDGLSIASATYVDGTLGGDNILFGLFDTNAGVSADPNDFLNTAIYDNIVVAEVPEPSAVSLAGLIGLGLLRRRRRA